MRDLRRFYPPDREVLKGINLSFYPGAKIGVIGSNGSGKSSLLKIMAGLDRDFSGEARLTPGFKVGFLSQEPELDETKDVAGNVAEGLGESMELIERFNALCLAMGEPDADFDRLLNEQSELQSKIDAADAWDLGRTIDIAMDALRLPPGDSRSVDCCFQDRICCCSTSRQITLTPSLLRGWSARCRITQGQSSR